MSHPREHTCRLKDPELFDQFRRENGKKEHQGRKYDVMHGRRKSDGEWEKQAFRYPKGTWSVAQARKHSRSHKGRFEAASGRSPEHSSVEVQPPPRTSSIVVDRLPPDAFALVVDQGDGKFNLRYPHHWVRKGEICEIDGRYVSGEMFVHRGMLIEAMRKAKEEGAPEEAIQHMQGHIDDLGVKIRQLAPAIVIPEPIARRMRPGMTSDMLPADLPIFGQADLDRMVVEIDTRSARSGDDIEKWEMEKINSIALADLDRKELFTFSMWASNELPDSYGTRQDLETTLRNYVADLIDSRSLMKSHGIGGRWGITGSATDMMPIGNSFQGDLTQRDGKQGTWLRGRYYILLNTAVGDGLNTNDIVRNLRAGIWRRASIGFTIEAMEGREKGWYKCEICNNDLMSEDCDHLPNFKYEGKLCIARVMGGSLRETSLAYMNAAQGTVVEKAIRMAKDGKLDDKAMLAFQLMSGVRLPDSRGVVTIAAGPGGGSPGSGSQEEETKAGAAAPPGGQAPETEQRGKRKKEKRTMEVARAVLTTLMRGIHEGLPQGTKIRRTASDALGAIDAAEGETEARQAVDTFLGTFSTEMQTIQDRATGAEALVAELPEAAEGETRTPEKVRELVEFAKIGRTHREAVVTEALAQGVRADKDGFDKDHWTELFASKGVEFVQKQGDLWKQAADRGLKSGRISDDGSGPEPDPKKIGKPDPKTGRIPDTQLSDKYYRDVKTPISK